MLGLKVVYFSLIMNSVDQALCLSSDSDSASDSESSLTGPFKTKTDAQELVASNLNEYSSEKEKHYDSPELTVNEDFDQYTKLQNKFSYFYKRNSENLTQSRRIFDGVRAKIHEWPFIASISVYDDFLCAGAIVKTYLILTSAACVKTGFKHNIVRGRENFIKVRVGSNYHNIGGKVIKVASVFFHPEYNDETYQNNLAMLKLTQKMPLREEIKLIAFRRTHNSLDGKVFVAGWRNDKESKPLTNFLSFVKLDIMDLRLCKSFFSSLKVSEENFCANKEDYGTETCKYDGGGPAIMQNTLVGITSSGYPTCKLGAPTVFTKLSEHFEWIDRILKMKWMEPSKTPKPHQPTPKEPARQGPDLDYQAMVHQIKNNLIEEHGLKHIQRKHIVAAVRPYKNHDLFYRKLLRDVLETLNPKTTVTTIIWPNIYYTDGIYDQVDSDGRAYPLSTRTTARTKIIRTTTTNVYTLGIISESDSDDSSYESSKISKDQDDNHKIQDNHYDDDEDRKYQAKPKKTGRQENIDGKNRDVNDDADSIKDSPKQEPVDSNHRKTEDESNLDEAVSNLEENANSFVADAAEAPISAPLHEFDDAVAETINEPDFTPGIDSLLNEPGAEPKFEPGVNLPELVATEEKPINTIEKNANTALNDNVRQHNKALKKSKLSKISKQPKVFKASRVAKSSKISNAIRISKATMTSKAYKLNKGIKSFTPAKVSPRVRSHRPRTTKSTNLSIRTLRTLKISKQTRPSRPARRYKSITEYDRSREQALEFISKLSKF